MDGFAQIVCLALGGEMLHLLLRSRSAAFSMTGRGGFCMFRFARLTACTSVKR